MSITPLDSNESRKRKREYIAIALLCVLFVLLFIAEFRLTKLSSTLPFVNSIFFFGLLDVNIVILIALVWLVLRNVGKLFIERRRRVLGSRLKTKLVISFLAFAVIPTLVLFFIAALYINSSFDKWFSLKIQNTFQASLDITRTYYRNTDQNAMHFAEHLSSGIGERVRSAADLQQPATHGSLPEWIHEYLDSQRELLALDAVELYSDPIRERALSQRAVEDAQRASAGELLDYFPRLPLDLLEKAFAGEKVSAVQHIGAGDLIRCLAPVRVGGRTDGSVAGVMVVDSYIPVSLVNKVDEIASVLDDYKATNPLKYPMKTTYLVILVMITLVVLFVAIWIGLYLAREITLPVERLVEGAQSVGSGNLDVAIQSSGHDEISVLIESFNKMTLDLRDNRERLTEASEDLERRRLQLEAVLANINTGVIAVDSRGKVTTFNKSAAMLLEVDAKEVEGKDYRDSLRGESTYLTQAIELALDSSAGRSEQTEEYTQWNFRSEKEGVKVLAAMITRLREADTQWGVVVVIDDLTQVIKGQREMAWREVARRIAHEIKNPLTPIKLSAQRLQRRMGDLGGADGEVLKECTDTIIRHTDELKEMVNEFSNFARFPEISPAPHDLNVALNEVILLYKQAHPQIQFKSELEAKLPVFEFDRDQIKRVAINLLDNACAALQFGTAQKRAPQIKIASHYNEQLQIAIIEIEDNGPGMTEEVRARVFEPYFSTKTGGTGLGLAIAKRIVNDHDGFIRVQSLPEAGTKFLIELPTAVRQGLDR